MYQLYSFPYSPHSRRVVSLLEQIGIDYENHIVPMMEGGHMTAEYLRINPNHQVPTLIDGAIRIHESNAILRYVCVKHELADWYPRAGEAFAQVEQWLDWNQSQLAKLMVDIVLNRVFLGEHGNLQAADAAEEQIRPKFDVMEDYLNGREFFAASHPTIADLSLASNLFQLNYAQLLPQTPNISRWYQTIAALPGFQKSLPQDR